MSKNLEPIRELENVKIYKDFGAFGDGKWQKHLTLASWFGNEPKYDLRTWNEDMTKCGKGISLESSELYDLLTMLEDALGVGEDDDSESEDEYSYGGIEDEFEDEID